MRCEVSQLWQFPSTLSHPALVGSYLICLPPPLPVIDRSLVGEANLQNSVLMETKRSARGMGHWAGAVCRD